MDRKLHIVIDEGARPDGLDVVRLECLPAANDVAPWRRVGLTSRLAMRAFPLSSLPQTIAGRVACVMEWLHGVPIVDEWGNETGERTAPLITEEQARRLLAVSDVDEAA